MGDYRAHIKIEMDFGKKFTVDMSINYWPESGCDGVDQRVIDWFRNAYEEGRNIIDADIIEAERKSREVAQERFERGELARLKEKYER